MRKQKPKRVIYYTDELNEDFAGTKIKTKTVDEKFKYVHTNPIWRGFAFFVYYFIAIPLIWFYERILLRVRFVNKKAVKRCNGQPYFLYGNHTGFIDAFTPNLISFPKSNKIIVSPDTVSVKGLKNLTKMLGAIPLPTGRRGMKQFVKAVDYYHQRFNITVYPEAHIWPYYTGVRAFADTSFAYPVKYHAPVFAFFTAYTKPKGFLSCFRKANVTVYVSDPIFPGEGLTGKAAREDLRNQVYAFMLEKSKLSDHNVIEYIKRTDNKE